MNRKIEIGKNGRVNIKWKVRPMDYSEDGEKNIKAKFAQKYGIDVNHISVEPVFIVNASGESTAQLTAESAQNIQDPVFQQSLFEPYLIQKEIEYDEDDLKAIIGFDDLINTDIDYDAYEKHKRYTLKWMKWSNFMSYGPDNFFDFTKLRGIVHLCSEPANQGGKSTFSIDLFRFFLFGKIVDRETDWTLARVFNDHIPSATEVVVEGCIEIDGVDYVIKRTVTRPAKRTEKSKVAQKVLYYRYENGKYFDLYDEDDLENETLSSTKETNKCIKEAIGNERDFDLMICANDANLKDLISLKDTERGRLIARWIGLLPLEEKDKLAREYFNKSVQPKLLLTKYNRVELEAEIDALKEEIEEITENGKKKAIEKEKSDDRLTELKEKRDVYVGSRIPMDAELDSIDKHSVELQKEKYTTEGKRKKEEKEANEAKLSELAGVVFDENEYKDLVSGEKSLSIEISNLEKENIRKNYEIQALKNGEFCPTCGAKLKNVDNTEKIKEAEASVKANLTAIKKKKAEQEKMTKKIESLDDSRTKYNEKVRLELIVDKNEVDLENLRSKLKECNRILKDLEKNEKIIRKNNEITAKINVIDATIKEEEAVNRRLSNEIVELRTEYKADAAMIEEKTKTVEIILEEEILVRRWKIYLDIVGKNGIAKMVLRESLPMINGELRRLLDGVCDFDVEVDIDNHNDVTFYKIHDGVKAGLGGGSGFEQTVASLALRSVLSRMSTFSKPSFVVFDEVLGGVADENYDQVKKLYDKIAADYSFIFQISHLKQIADWATQTIVVKKENNVSRICEA